MPIEDTVPKVTITLKEYEDLLADSFFLEALSSAGVDNWEGYEEAQNIYEEMNTPDEAVTVKTVH